MKIKFLIKNKFFLASQHIFFGLTLAAFFPFLKKYLDVGVISQIGIFLSLGLMGQVIVNFCFQITGQTLIKKQKIKSFLTSYFFDIFYTKLALFFVLSIFLILLCNIIGFELYSNYLYVLLIGLPFCSVFNFTWVFYRLNQFKFLFYLSFFTVILQILCLYLYKEYSNFIFVIFFLIFPYLIPQVITFIILFTRASYKQCSIRRIINTINKGKEIFLSQVVSIFYGLGGVILIKVFSDDQQAADYLIVEKFFAPIISFSILIIPSSFPTMIDYFYKKSFDELLNTIKFTFLIFVILFLIFIILFFSFDKYLKYYFFENISSSLTWSYFLIFFMSYFGASFTNILSLKKDYIFLRNINLLILLLLFVLGPGAILIYGALGWVITYFIVHILIFFFYFKRILFFK